MINEISKICKEISDNQEIRIKMLKEYRSNFKILFPEASEEAIDDLMIGAEFVIDLLKDMKEDVIVKEITKDPIQDIYSKALESMNELISMVEKDYEDVYDLYDDIKPIELLINKQIPLNDSLCTCGRIGLYNQHYCQDCGKRLYKGDVK